jgi:hypothetical protein
MGEASTQTEPFNLTSYYKLEESILDPTKPKEWSGAIPGMEIPQEGLFNLQNKRLLLTYTHIHFEKQEYIDWLTAIIKKKKKKIEFIRLAEETGHNNPIIPHPHMHVLIDFGWQFQTTNARFFDYKNIHPHIKRVISQKHWRIELGYIGKEDPENSDLKKMAYPIQYIWDHKSLSDALADTMHLKDVMPTIAAWEHKPDNSIVICPEPRWVHWNEKLVDLISVPVSRTDLDDLNRYIIRWIWDPKGKCGKTTTIQWLNNEYPNSFMVIAGMSNGRDMAEYLKGELERGWDHHCVLINCPKDAVDYKNLYSVVEQIKDGSISSFKWSGRYLRWNRPHVVVFSNELPHVEKLSEERWNIWQIINRTLYKQLPYDEVKLIKEEQQAQREAKLAFGIDSTRDKAREILRQQAHTAYLKRTAESQIANPHL